MTGDQKRALRDGIFAAIGAAAAGVGLYCLALGLTVEAWLRWTVAFGIPIALTIAGLAGPSVLKLVGGDQNLGWGNSALAGLLTAVGPLAIILIAVVSLRLAFGREVDFDNWGPGFLGLASSGIAGGLVFRALHGPGPVGGARK